MKKTVEYIMVLNNIYSVSCSDDLDGEGKDGECDVELKTIMIGSHCSEDRMKRVMLHELMHAFLYESGACEYIDLQAEEMLCQSVSGFLNNILNWTIKSCPDSLTHLTS